MSKEAKHFGLALGVYVVGEVIVLYRLAANPCGRGCLVWMFISSVASALLGWLAHYHGSRSGR